MDYIPHLSGHLLVDGWRPSHNLDAFMYCRCRFDSSPYMSIYLFCFPASVLALGVCVGVLKRYGILKKVL
jgi:hypothetical protein